MAVAAAGSSVDIAWFIKINDIDMANNCPCWTAVFKRTLLKKGQNGKEWMHLQIKQKALHHILLRVNFVSLC